MDCDEVSAYHAAMTMSHDVQRQKASGFAPVREVELERSLIIHTSPR